MLYSCALVPYEIAFAIHPRCDTTVAVHDGCVPLVVQDLDTFVDVIFWRGGDAAGGGAAGRRAGPHPRTPAGLTWR